MLRTARHAKILEIISQKEIETQEELCALFRAITQSRNKFFILGEISPSLSFIYA